MRQLLCRTIVFTESIQRSYYKCRSASRPSIFPLANSYSTVVTAVCSLGFMRGGNSFFLPCSAHVLCEIHITCWLEYHIIDYIVDKFCIISVSLHSHLCISHKTQMNFAVVKRALESTHYLEMKKIHDGQCLRDGYLALAVE
jgi:hypothetical protein